jgi:molecular chaperone GrpE
MSRRSGKPNLAVDDPRRNTGSQRRGAESEEMLEKLQDSTASASPEPSRDEGVPVSLEDYNSLMEDYKRLAAEFDNYRKRQARDFNRLISQGRRQLMTELLSVLDNFDRARETLDGSHPESEIIAGLLQIGTHLESLLQKEGLSEVETSEGDPFDPNIHEAMMAEDSEEEVSDAVRQVLQKGYRLGQDLIRPVRVKVIRGLKREVGGGGE